MANQKHVFDFEGILNMDVNQKNWREIKQKLDEAFGELKIGIAEGMAKADAEKYVKMLNQVFAKVEMPDIGVEDLKDRFDKVADSFTKAVASLHNIDISSLKNIEGSLDHIATQVDKIVDKVGKGVPKATKSTILSVKQLDNVLGKLGDSTKDIEGALNFSVEGDVKKQSAALRKLSNEIEELDANRIQAERNGAAEDAQNWIKRQQAMTKYVRVYDEYIKGVKKPNKDLVASYNKILPKSYDAKTNLQNLVDRRAGTYSEFKEPWAKEETLKKVLNVLQNGIKVEDKGGNKPPKNPTTPPPKRDAPQAASGITVYRTVYEPEEPDDRTRAEILEAWGGAEYWTNKKGVAETYADGQEKPVILKGNIVSEKPFIIDAKGHSWDKFQNMFAVKDGQETSLKDEFPEIFSRVAKGELFDPADIQTELNQAIKQLGHDVVEMRNVIDTNNPSSYKELSTTYSVLDDRILRIESAFAMEEQDRDGITTFEKNAYKKNIPEYYRMPEVAEVIAETIKEQVQTNVPKTQESAVHSEELSAISGKMDKLATDANVSAAKEAVVAAVKEGQANNNVTVDTSSLVEAMTDVLNKIQESQNKKDGVSVLLENNDLLGQLINLTKEGGLFYNSETGFSSDVVEGGAHRTETSMDAVENLAKLYDTRVHKHNFDIAAPSFSGDDNDFNAWLQVFDHIKKQVIVANKEVLSFDFSSLTKDTLTTISTLYSEAAGKIRAEFEGYAKDGKVGEMFGSLDNMDEQMQRRMRESLELIMKDYSGVMTSHKIPSEITNDKQSHLLNAISSLTDAIKQLSNAQNNADVVSAIQELSNRLGSMVGQDDSLQGIKSVLESIKSSGFNVDVSPESITMAIKEALYAGDIAAGYHKPEFDEVFEYDDDTDTWFNKIFGEVYFTLTEVEEEFNKYYKGKYLSNDGMWSGTKEEMLDNIAGVKGYDAEQDNWAQVVVEAINTQGGKIVEAIKIVLPQNVSESVTAGSGLDEAKIKNAFSILTDAILRFNDATGGMPRDFFGKLKKDDLTASVFRDPDVDDALRTLGLMDGDGKFTFAMPDTGIRNLGVAIADRLVVTSQDADNVDNILELQAKLDEASKLGAAVPRLLAVDKKNLNGTWSDEAIFQLQTRSPGVNVASSKAGNEFLKATDEQIDKLIHTFEVMSKIGLFPDFIGDNVLFDKEKGFSLIDLETQNIHRGPMDTPEDMTKAFLKNVLGQMWEPDGSVEEFKKRVNERLSLPSDQRLVDEFGRSKMANQAGLAGASVKLTPTMDDGAVARVVQENILKTPATVKLTPEIDETVSSPVEQLAENLTNKIVDWRKYDGAIDTLEDNPLLSQLSKWTLTPSEMMSFEPAKMQEMITDWINGIVSVDYYGYEGSPAAQFQSLLNSELAKLQPSQIDDVASKVSIDAEELKNVLNSITYNVKIIQDEDGADNKVAIDEASLEATLNKVFTNILNPQTQPSDSEPTQEPWAHESTLQAVKGVLDNIQINTSKIGAPTPTVDPIAGTTLESKLTEIKTVLESIEKKIVDGGKIFNRGGAKQAVQDAQKTSAQEQAARSNMMKSLINDYKTMGKLAAQFASDGDLETKAMLENLKDEIARKRQSLKLTMDENKSLREKYSIAFDAEKRLLDAAKAQKAIDDKNKSDAKELEKAWKKQVKDAQRATGINAATSAANAGDQTVIRAIGSEGVSEDIENKAKELSDRIEALRVLRDDIEKKGDAASEADRDNLSKQIVSVKTLKSELDEYLKIHEKYSGEGATQFDVDTSGFGAVGTNQYWNNITAAIQKASGNRVIIKGMNADTGELTGTTKIAANTFAEWSATVDPVTGKLSMLRTGIKKTETIIEAITRKTKEVFTYFSGSSIIFKAFNELKKGIQYIREIDAALTELRKVTNETEETYDRFLKTAAKTGAKLGTTISAVTEATATFAKLGYSMEMATEMAEAAIVYKNVGDNIASTGDAADSIISTLKGFRMEASEAMAIVDRFNEVGNNFAITSQGIGEALRLSASALNEGKNSLDESIALITAANEVVGFMPHSHSNMVIRSDLKRGNS
jgi:hypothetical protein